MNAKKIEELNDHLLKLNRLRNMIGGKNLRRIYVEEINGAEESLDDILLQKAIPNLLKLIDLEIQVQETAIRRAIE